MAEKVKVASIVVVFPCGERREMTIDEAKALHLQLAELFGAKPLVVKVPTYPYITGTTTRYCTLTPFTLTDAEREAVERVSVAYDLLPTEGAQQVSATLRGLLERLGGSHAM